MSNGGKDRGARERSRVYQARLAFHERQNRRRSRDNLIAGIAGGALIVAIAAAQTLYFTSGPGAPEPTPTPTATTPAPTPSTTPSIAPTPEPTTTP